MPEINTQPDASTLIRHLRSKGIHNVYENNKRQVIIAEHYGFPIALRKSLGGWEMVKVPDYTKVYVSLLVGISLVYVAAMVYGGKHWEAIYRPLFFAFMLWPSYAYGLRQRRTAKAELMSLLQSI